MDTWFAVHAATFGDDNYLAMEGSAAAEAEACDTDFYAH
jgi:hypothetical protein